MRKLYALGWLVMLKRVVTWSYVDTRGSGEHVTETSRVCDCDVDRLLQFSQLLRHSEYHFQRFNVYPASKILKGKEFNLTKKKCNHLLQLLYLVFKIINKIISTPPCNFLRVRTTFLIFIAQYNLVIRNSIRNMISNELNMLRKNGWNLCLH